MTNRDPDRSDKTSASAHYNADYFTWQQGSGAGAFGGWANAFKFAESVGRNDTVADFGCGGGFLLQNLKCKARIGIEPNATAAQSVKSLGIQHFFSPREAVEKLGRGAADVIISTNALEHALNPLQEIKDLRPLLKTGGTIHFVVPCETIHMKYVAGDINHHLFSWSPQSLGNLFSEAGYRVLSSKPDIYKWPPFYAHFAKLGWPAFNMICKIYGRLERSWFQVELKAVKDSD